MSTNELNPVFAAGAAMAFSFPLYVTKSSLQLGKGLPQVQSLFKGVTEAVPLTGAIVGSQLLAKKELKKVTDSEVLSSLAVATFSSPLLIALNGVSVGNSVAHSLKTMTLTMAGTTVLRESFFLLPMGNEEKDYATTFANAVGLNLLASPADCFLTRMQKSVPTTHWKQLLLGAPTRALFSGTFAVCYKFFEEKLKG